MKTNKPKRYGNLKLEEWVVTWKVFYSTRLLGILEVLNKHFPKDTDRIREELRQYQICCSESNTNAALKWHTVQRTICKNKLKRTMYTLTPYGERIRKTIHKGILYRRRNRVELRNRVHQIISNNLERTPYGAR